MADKKQIIFGAVATLVVGFGCYLMYTLVVNANFTKLKQKTGIKQTDSEGAVKAMAGGGKYMFAFFNNNRFSVFSADGMKLYVKGNYEMGGSTLITDGGTTYENPSVFTNMNLLVDAELKDKTGKK